MSTSPQPDPIDTSEAYRQGRAGRSDWDTTAGTEGGARSGASGSTIYSDRQDAPLMAEPLLRRGRLAHLWTGARRRLRELVGSRPS